MSDIKIFKPRDKVECVAWGCGRVISDLIPGCIMVYFSAVDQSFRYNTDGTPVSCSPDTAHNYTLSHRTKKKK